MINDVLPVVSVENTPELSDLKRIFNGLKNYFDSGNTLDIQQRKVLLKALYTEIEKRSDELCAAAFTDFHKPKSEMLLTEIYTVLAEIKYTVAHIDRWSKPERASTNLLLMPANSKIYYSPKGVVLAISTWNYPFYLSMMPLICAIAAGNTVMLKPAHETPEVAKFIHSVVSAVFPTEYVSVVLGPGKTLGPILLDNFVFNHIFFTGSQSVGKWVMLKAAENLTPLTLELGGKSPAIVDKDYDVDYAAKKIVWGKFINCGQTCVSADYALVHESQYAAFIEACKKYIGLFWGKDVFQSDEYAHIISPHRFDRLLELMQGLDVLHGGRHDAAKLCIEPTLAAVPDLNHPIMKEEIFGPILPVIPFKTEGDILSLVRRNRYPLSLYIFSKQKALKDFILQRIEFGGGCLNNTVYHLGNPNLPFGGVGNSGFGNYHGKHGFMVFSNIKPVLNTAKWFDISLLYQPYTQLKHKIIKWFFMR
ncbi:MAG: aldehyde dehydrogenase family protein [Saprospiraceae bacterium]|nr:aldehyde dehydrogenase family protein [Saprospiraceae bacterium]